jgi:[FeFe] hydrogenase H-cluster maturation GTPase HydF
MIRATQKGFRLHIGIFGRRNVGKSSLLNAITRQSVSIVSEVAGTTTDPVEKPMELLPIGPVLFVDTAGVDDEGALGAQRVEKTRQVISRSDVGVLVVDAGQWGPYEEKLLAELQAQATPALIAFNKSDLGVPDEDLKARLDGDQIPHIEISATTGLGVDEFRHRLAEIAPAEPADSPVVLRDLVGPDQIAVLVMPIDKEAPKGRIKQLQVQSIRDLLDDNASCMVVQDSGLARVLDSLKMPPRIVVTDAQVFDKVASVTPDSVPLTAFSILFSRLKGDLVEQARAAAVIDTLKPGDRVLIAESCSHHPIEDDIGRIKIPRLLESRVGGKLEFAWTKGREFPADLKPFKLIIHCGACMWNRREMMSRIRECRSQLTPITNYGVAIAHLMGNLERALEPFPEALAAFREARAEQTAAAIFAGVHQETLQTVN